MKWYQKIRFVEAKTKLGQMDYMMDEKLNFIPCVKKYLNMIQARAEEGGAPNTSKIVKFKKTRGALSF